MNYIDQVKNKIGKFPIGCWIPYYKEELNEKYLETIKECNINFVPSISHDKEELDLINKAGLSAIVNDDRIVYANVTNISKISNYLNEYIEHPSYFMSFIWDEPSPTMMNISGAINKELQKDDRAIGYINLHPNYSDKVKQRNNLSYRKYLNYYIKTCNPKVLSFDNYPFYKRKDKIDNFIANVALISKISKENNIPFVGFIQSGAFFQNADVNEEKLRLLVNLLLVFGAKGYLYFTYHEVTHEDGFGAALIDRNGQKTEKYYYAKKINEKVLKYSDILLNSTIVGIKGMGKYDKYTTYHDNINISLDSGIVGIFKYNDNYIYMAINPELSLKSTLVYNKKEVCLEKGEMCLIFNDEIHTI